MKITKRPSTVVSRKKAQSNKKVVSSGRKHCFGTSGKLVPYNGALTVLYGRDLEETNAAVAIVSSSNIASLKAKYARFEKKA